MNARTIIAADGLPRRAFTVADVERMVEAGVIGEDERVELVDGELIPMSPKGNRHEILKTALLMDWVPRRPKSVLLAVETTLRLSGDTYLEPDILLFRRSVGFGRLNGPSVLLAVEIGVSSLGYDLGRKAAVYAAFGVPELWVVDAARLVVHIHLQPGPEGYGSVTPRTAGDLIVPRLVPDLTLRLADLDLDELADPDLDRDEE
ncbi:Uma2 family endonuclease [Prosthecomicrobium sp. N25]|uniref:Uma2 family endonuclease n=1 Tax=Prosthecomicrobium sp. N25 TaxID=3129254 RepID=UPI00307805B7